MRIVKCNNPLKVEDVIFSGNSCNHRNLDSAICMVVGDTVVLQVSRVKYVCTFDTNWDRFLFLMELVTIGVGFQ